MLTMTSEIHSDRQTDKINHLNKKSKHGSRILTCTELKRHWHFVCFSFFFFIYFFLAMCAT